MSSHIATTYLARFSVVLSTLVLVPVVAPAVGLESYGLYALVTAMAVIFAQDLGMAAATTRFAADAWARGDLSRLKSVSAASAVYFACLAVLITCVLAAAYALVLPTIDTSVDVDVMTLVSLALGNAFVGMALSTHRQILAGAGRLDLANYVLIGQAFVRVAMTSLVLLTSSNVVVVVAVDFFTTLGGGAVAWYLRRRTVPASNARARDLRLSVLKELLRFSADLLVMTVSAVVILQAGSLLASLLLPIGAVAVYAAASRAFLFVREAGNSLTMALLPTSASNAARADLQANQRLFLEGTRLVNAVLLVLLVPVLVFTKELLDLWVGPDLASGYVAAQILIASMLANNNHLLAIPILTGMGKIRPYSVLHAVWAIFGVGLTVGLAPQFGVAGVALGLTIPVLILEPFYLMVAVRALNLSARRFMLYAVLPPYAIGILPGLLLFLCGLMAENVSPLLMGAMCLLWCAMLCLLYWRFLLNKSQRSAVASRLRVALNA